MVNILKKHTTLFEQILANKFRQTFAFFSAKIDYLATMTNISRTTTGKGSPELKDRVESLKILFLLKKIRESGNGIQGRCHMKDARVTVIAILQLSF